ncbi:MAG TPA: hypothetical protein VMP01_18375 [Pirellulaceae bacterium]|nr:hypothetical protein [Pirellulaceae bacterium]
MPRARIADNQTATIAEWDKELLPLELADLKSANFDLGLLGFSEDDLAKWLQPVQDGLCDPDEVPAPPDAATTKPGDITPTSATILPSSRAHDLYFSQGIVWDKMHPVLTRKDFLGCFEICFYGWKLGAGHKFFGPANVPDLWHVKKVNPQSMIHLTEKSVELAVRANARAGA